MTGERSEFVTNAYKYSASVANFKRISNIFIRKHIRKHIRLCVRAALRYELVLKRTQAVLSMSMISHSHPCLVRLLPVKMNTLGLYIYIYI